MPLYYLWYCKDVFRVPLMCLQQLSVSSWFLLFFLLDLLAHVQFLSLFHLSNVDFFLLVFFSPDW